MNDLRNEIGNLSAAEKFDLLDALWDSLETNAPPLTDAYRAELDHRIAQYEQNPSDVIPWEQVRAAFCLDFSESQPSMLSRSFRLNLNLSIR